MIETLLLPFSEGIIDARQSAFFIRAEASQALKTLWEQGLRCEQTLRNEYLPLEEAGFEVCTRIDETYQLGLCLLTKHKKENYGNIARVLAHLEVGGLLVCVGGNDIGVKSMEKNVGKNLPVSGNLSKNHCRVFWIEKTKDTKGKIPDEWIAFSKLGHHISGEEDYLTQPGMFSWDKIDKGSAYLVENFPRGIKGKVADFGSGWGYLSRQLLEQSPLIDSLDLFENEWLAVEASKQNLAGVDGFDKLTFHWQDLAERPPAEGHYNWIVMNPPFHNSARTDVGLGCKFIAHAAKALKNGGDLLMVANRQLPYEREVNQFFKAAQRLAENAEFKVIHASNPYRSPGKK